ncbi:2-ketoarginine methyltransferase [Virgisporangium aliadipatigenens]|uniref:2-ketoarginine methyltransferase n=1 Tax=Virgisporangium aliadipatigenens TaxID=741659 RepID=A0A8J3YHS4_9ACTN|nr:hypothetical protein [Virgisporangium aliadipatigenens]GIJ44240.1 2-ketoarginine methyltransferase [Virgisporangium aliadipatigenens]
MTTGTFEQGLVDAIQPIRYMAIANALFHLFDTGIYASLAAQNGISCVRLAAERNVDPDRLAAFLAYLAAEGYVAYDGGWRLTGKARAIEPFQPWYTLLVGGYATTFRQLGDALRTDAPWAGRDGARVGAGSCGMSAHDAVPMVERLLDRLPPDAPTVVDLGCGDGGFLVELCKRRADLIGIGLEPDAYSVELAKSGIVAAGLENRLSVRQGRASDALTLENSGDGTLCFMAAFVLQEMLEQEGRSAVCALLRDTVRRHPHAYWAIVEVDHRPDDAVITDHPLGIAYYNPYFLLHAITEQKLETRDFWERLFAEAGLEIVAVEHPPRDVDSTDLELGYLLRAVDSTAATSASDAD